MGDAALYPTKTRLHLMRELEAGEVWLDRDDNTYLYADDGTSRRLVNAAITELIGAGWVELETLQYARQWRLTDAGRQVLADADGDGRG